MNSTVQQIRAMLADGQINEKDRRHAGELANHTPADELTKANLNWLESLAKRGGGRFVKP